jgi:hypothetical protein
MATVPDHDDQLEASMDTDMIIGMVFNDSDSTPTSPRPTHGPGRGSSGGPKPGRITLKSSSLYVLHFFFKIQYTCDQTYILLPDGQPEAPADILFSAEHMQTFPCDGIYVMVPNKQPEGRRAEPPILDAEAMLFAMLFEKGD